MSNHPTIVLEDVSLRFVTYHDKYYSLKRALLDLFIRNDQGNQQHEFWGLSDINLRIEQGERVGVLGPNGAGKSTLLRVLAGIYPPTTGRVSVDGRIAPLIEIGAGFNYELSGYENILLNGALLGFSRRQMLAKVEGIWEFSGLREFADLHLKYYSSGMLSRLAFAVATEVLPDVLLLDETLSVGDAAFVDKARERITKVIDYSKVVMIVSHDMAGLRSLCTRGLWIDGGRIRMDGPIDSVVDAYLEEVSRTQLEAA